MNETLYKVLAADGTPCHGGTGKWYLPKLQPDGTYKPGRWMPEIAGIRLCARGYHLCRRGDVIHWLHETIYEAEWRGERLDDTNKVVVGAARLLRPLAWNETTARLFAADCSEDALPFWEQYHPDDMTPHTTIAIARRYARGDATYDELAAAWSAAKSAAKSAAESAVWSAAAASAAKSAAKSAARAAAKSAARAAQTERLFDYLEGRRS